MARIQRRPLSCRVSGAAVELALHHAVIVDLQYGVAAVMRGTGVQQQDAAVIIDKGLVRVAEERGFDPLLLRLNAEQRGAALDHEAMPVGDQDALSAYRDDLLPRKGGKITVTGDLPDLSEGRGIELHIPAAIPQMDDPVHLFILKHHHDVAEAALIAMRIGHDTECDHGTAPPYRI